MDFFLSLAESNIHIVTFIFILIAQTKLNICAKEKNNLTPLGVGFNQCIPINRLHATPRALKGFL